MHLLKLSTAATVLVGPVLDPNNLPYTGAVIGDFNLTKNGTTAAMAAAATATHDHNGHYLIALTTGNTDTLGRLTISLNKAGGYAMGMFRYEVLAAAMFDGLVTNALAPSDLQTIKGQAITCANPVTFLANVGFAAAPGAANGATFCGSNAAATFATLTVTGAMSVNGSPLATLIWADPAYTNLMAAATAIQAVTDEIDTTLEAKP